MRVRPEAQSAREDPGHGAEGAESEQSRGGWLDAGSSMAHVGMLGWPAETRAHKGGLENASHQANAARFVCTQMLQLRVHLFSFASISSATGSCGAAATSHQLPVHPTGLNSLAIHKVFEQQSRGMS